MPRKTKAKDALPTPVSARLRALGLRLRHARIARGRTQAQVADAAFIDRTTLARLERGEGAVSLAVLGSVLFVLQLDGTLDRVADAADDAVVRAAQAARAPRSARPRKPSSELDF